MYARMLGKIKVWGFVFLHIEFIHSEQSKAALKLLTCRFFKINALEFVEHIPFILLLSFLLSSFFLFSSLLFLPSLSHIFSSPQNLSDDRTMTRYSDAYESRLDPFISFSKKVRASSTSDQRLFSFF